MKIKLLVLLCCLAIVSNIYADPPSSASYTLVQRGFLAGNADQATPPGSAGYVLTENSMLGIADDVLNSTGFMNYPGFLQPNNHAPTIVIPPELTFPEDDGLVVDFAPFINDINGDIVTLSVSGNTEVLVDIVDFTVTFSATPDWNGTETLTFTANDNMDRAVASDIVDIVVTPVNDDPTIVLPDDFTFEEDEELIVDFSAFAEDVDLDDLTLTVTGNTEITADIVDLQVTFGAAENWNGTETLTFTVDDGQGERVSFTTSKKVIQKSNVTNSENSRATADDIVDIIVLPVNDDPTIVLPDDFTFEEDDGLIVDFSAFVDDIDLDDLTLTVTGNTEVSVEILALEVTFGAAANWNGTETLTFTVDDGQGERVSLTTGKGEQKQKQSLSENSRATADDVVNIIVVPVNDDPTIVLPDDFTFEEDEELIVDFTDFIDDIDMDDLTLTVTGNTETTVDINELEVTFGVTADWNGTETLTFTINDNVTRATAEDDVDVIVTAVNDEPVLIGYLPDVLEFTVEEDSMVTFSVEVEDIDSTIEYEWYVDDVLQAEITEEFVYTFEIVGDIAIKSIAFDEEYEIETIWMVEVEAGSEAGLIIPINTALGKNYPNPFNPETTINYAIVDAGLVKIEIFNIKGEKIRTLVNEHKNIGYYSIVWNGKDYYGKKVSSGMYFYNMKTDKYHKFRKMILLK